MITLLVVAAFGLSAIFLSNHKDPRSSYEKHLLKSAGELPSIEPGPENDSESGEEENEPGFDSPDIAAYSEYVKTMDPATREVPAGRLSEAYRETRMLAGLKSGSGGLTWTHHPTNYGGRTRVLFPDPNDDTGKRVFAGSVTGGLWFNDDPFGNGTWQSVNDFWPNLSVSCMASDPDNPQVMYVGTGESQTAIYIYRESSTRGIGILRSSDGGITWDLMESTKDWAYVTDIVIRKESGINVLYAGVVSGLYKGSLHQSNPSDGLYRSTDGGAKWTQVLPLITGAGRPYAPSDIELSADGSRIFVGTTYHGQDRAGAACILWSDNGTEWNVMDAWYNRLSVDEVWARNGITYKYPGRVMLAKAPSNPSVIYAAIAGGYVRGDQFVGYDCRFILRSGDKGITWTEINHPDVNNTSVANLAWHALAISVDPRNENTLWIGGLDVWRTMNSGQTWQQMSYWAPAGEVQLPYYVHADIHTILFNSDNPEKVLIGTDGGVFSTNESTGESPVFSEKNLNYSTLQFYSGAIHPQAGLNHFTGGLQDNGTLLYMGPGIPDRNYRIGGGDGAYCFIDENEPDIHLATVYYTSIIYWKITDPDQVRQLGGYNYNVGTFVNPMDYDWRYNILYANGCHFTGLNANTLRIIKVLNDRLAPYPSDPLWQVPTNSPVPYSCIKWYENSGEEASTIYIGTESGRLYRLAEAPVVGELTDLTHPDLPVGYINSIDLGSTEDTILLTYTNYGVPSVWVTADAGKSWKNAEANLPDMPIRWGIFHPKNARQVMLATETGIWTTPDVFAPDVTWKPDNNGMANVRVDMLKFRKSDNTVLAATHGRGMFTTVWEPKFTSGIREDVKGVKDVRVYPNPCDGHFRIEFEINGIGLITITDIAGRVVLSEEIAQTSGQFQKSCDLSREPRGTYIIKIISDGKSLTSRLVLN